MLTFDILIFRLRVEPPPHIAQTTISGTLAAQLTMERVNSGVVNPKKAWTDDFAGGDCGCLATILPQLTHNYIPELANVPIQ